ncbi:hypothetical protein D3C81_1664080 [compost metagenome]
MGLALAIDYLISKLKDVFSSLWVVHIPMSGDQVFGVVGHIAKTIQALTSVVSQMVLAIAINFLQGRHMIGLKIYRVDLLTGITIYSWCLQPILDTLLDVLELAAVVPLAGSGVGVLVFFRHIIGTGVFKVM